jgi:hypothetical protein
MSRRCRAAAPPPSRELLGSGLSTGAGLAVVLMALTAGVAMSHFPLTLPRTLWFAATFIFGLVFMATNNTAMFSILLRGRRKGFFMSLQQVVLCAARIVGPVVAGAAINGSGKYTAYFTSIACVGGFTASLFPTVYRKLDCADAIAAGRRDEATAAAADDGTSERTPLLLSLSGPAAVNADTPGPPPR